VIPFCHSAKKGGAPTLLQKKQSRLTNQTNFTLDTFYRTLGEDARGRNTSSHSLYLPIGTHWEMMFSPPLMRQSDLSDTPQCQAHSYIKLKEIHKK
jgi:hypothetical protein